MTMADAVVAPDDVPSTIGQPMVVGPTANDDKEKDKASMGPPRVYEINGKQ